MPTKTATAKIITLLILFFSLLLIYPEKTGADRLRAKPGFLLIF
jgi:hypothetical protein